MLGCKRFDHAAVTISGLELVQKIQKGQFKTVKTAGRPSHSPGSLGGVVGGLIVNDWATSSINPFPRICTITLHNIKVGNYSY
jgi:hypothetical protein